MTRVCSCGDNMNCSNLVLFCVYYFSTVWCISIKFTYGLVGFENFQNKC